MPSFEDILLQLSRESGMDEDRLSVLGKTAAKRLIEDGVDPNVAVQKIAHEEGLKASEVQRVCEFANLEGYSHGMKTAGQGDKTFEFPLADYREVVAPAEKTAGPAVFATDYDCPPDRDLCKTASVDMDIFEAFGVSPVTEKVASLHRADGLIEKLQLLAQNERDKLAMKMEEMAESAEGFFQHIKQEVLKGKSFDDVEKAVKAKAEGKPYADRIQELTGYVKRRMYDAGILQHPARTGDSGATPDTIQKQAEPVERDLLTDTFESPGVPVMVLNGGHPLYASIDTLVRQFDEHDKSKNNLIILDDKIRYTKNRVYGKQPS